ncbi:MAG: peptide chain release factor N(5)-glutamine methyltransferase [Ferruginibacter sp.]
MHWKELYQLFLNELTLKYGMDEAVAISRLCFEEMAGKDRFFILTKGNEQVDITIETAMLHGLTQLKNDVPVQHITGKAWFRNLHLKVTPDTLIPRPETEELVQQAIDFIEKENKKSVLDIGTGSGCIAVSIKKECGQVLVTAIDYSKKALEVAIENATKQQTPITFVEMNFLEEKNCTTLPIFDVIISNPPYIPIAQKDLIDKNVTAHEPAMALFVEDEQPLIFYEKIALFAQDHLMQGGQIFMETHWQYAYEVAAYFIAHGFEARVIKDFFDKERIVAAIRRQ